jgi:hypothetical protein
MTKVNYTHPFEQWPLKLNMKDRIVKLVLGEGILWKGGEKM